LRYLNDVEINLKNIRYLIDKEKNYKDYIDSEMNLYKRKKIKEHFELLKNMNKNILKFISDYETSSIHTILGDKLEFDIITDKLRSQYIKNGCDCYWCQLNFTLSKNTLIKELLDKDENYIDFKKVKFNSILDHVISKPNINDPIELLGKEREMNYYSIKTYFKSIPNKVLAGYIIWIFINFYLLLRGFVGETLYYKTNNFYPFEGGSDYYDLTEFVIYAVAPIVVAIVFYYWKKPN
jgi:hypothetical protein